MKKTILTLAVAFATIFGFNAAAQTNGTQAPAKDKTERTEMKKEKKADRMARAFEGISLTDDQKSKIQALKPQKADKAKAQADKAKTKEAKAQAKVQKKEAKEKVRAEKRQARQDYLASLKTILTPEQYTKFLENNFVQKGSMTKGHRPGGKHGNGRDMAKSAGASKSNSAAQATAKAPKRTA